MYFRRLIPECVGHRLLMTALATCIFVCCVEQTCSGVDIFIEPVPRPKQNNNAGQFGFGDNFVEQQLFPQQQTAKKARKHLEEKLGSRIEILQGVFGLTETQKSDLELSGMGDIHVFMRECDKLVKKWKPDQGNWNQIWQEIHPLQSRLNLGLHEEGSMFNRTLMTLLDESQRTSLEDRREQMRVREAEVQIHQLVVAIDQQVCMEKDRRERLTTFLMDRIRIPKRNSDPQVQGMSSYLAYYQMALLPEEELKSHFLEEEWEQMEPQLKQLKGNAKQMKAQFKQMGIDLDLEDTDE